jgi:hypothetical protein
VTSFGEAWKRRYGSALPFGHSLRMNHRTIRFYALRGAKRYATTPEEEAEIRRRAHGIAGALFDAESDIWRVHCVHVDARDDADARSAAALPILDEVFEPWSEERFRVHAILERWEPSKHEALLHDLAEDVVANVLFFDATRGTVFAPYDGGFDVMFASDDAYEAMRGFEPTWSP